MFYLKKLKLINFRCYSNQEYEFSPYRNIIVGFNAVGKTSLVEAIHCLCFTKSFKSIKDIDLIRKGQEFYSLKAHFISKDDVDEVVVAHDSNNKSIKKNEKIFKSVSEYLGYFNTVVFSPDDLDFVKGSPAIRRRFLDINIGQIDKIYLNALIKYKKVLKERNEFLKTTDQNNFNKNLFEIMTDTLIQLSKVIIQCRRRFIDEINTHIKPISTKMSGGAEWGQLVYKPNCDVDNLLKTAKERASYDILSKVTTWGPSRDEVQVLVNNEEAANYCSQGQIRSACLSIKLGLAELYAKKNDKIIIILDDVFSELDINRQNELLKLLDKSKQTFITTTSIDNISQEVLNGSKIIEITRRR